MKMNIIQAKKIAKLLTLLETIQAEQKEIAAIAQVVAETNEGIAVSMELPFIPDNHQFDFDEDEEADDNILGAFKGIIFHSTAEKKPPTISKHIAPSTMLRLLNVLSDVNRRVETAIHKQLKALNISHE